MRLSAMNEQGAGADRALGGALRDCPAACQVEGACDRQGAVPVNALTARAAVLQCEIGRSPSENTVVTESNPAGMGIAAKNQSARTDLRQFGGADFEPASRKRWQHCTIDQNRYCVSRRQRHAISIDGARYKNNASRTLNGR